jgi:glutathione peroxidase
MTIRQQLMKLAYPLIMLLGKKNTQKNETAKAKESFYNLNATNNKGQSISMEQYKGKNILIVNTASNCGFTNQYDDLEKLYKSNAPNLIILGFPANDFKKQEAGSDAEIAEFCRINFGVTFPLMQKSVVVKTKEQNTIFNWLSNPALNGWNAQEPTWNFCKYLINKDGELTHFFAQNVSPLSKEITDNL